MVQFGFKIPHILIVICAMLAAALADKALNGPLTFLRIQFLEHDFIKTKYQSGPIFTNVFPKFSPLKRAMSVRKNKPTRAGFAAELHCLYVLWGFNLLNGNFRWLVYNL